MLDKKDKSQKIQLSLASSMFFAPFIKNLIKKKQIEIDIEDKKFVDGYIRLGFIIIGFLFLTIASALSMYFFITAIFVWAYKISSILLIISLLLGTIGPIAGLKILQEDQEIFHYQKIKNDKSDIFLSFLPIYNVFLWYKLHDFEHPYRWAKESFLRWTLFIIVSLTMKSEVGSIVVLMMIIVRISSLLSGIDFLDEHIKKKLNKLFYKNTEELRAYPRSLISFGINKLSGNTQNNFNSILVKEKEILQHLHKSSDKKIIAQYIIALLLLSIWFFCGGEQNLSFAVYIPIIILLGKYILMLTKRKHAPQLPIAREIVDLGMVFQKKIKQKFSK